MNNKESAESAVPYSHAEVAELAAWSREEGWSPLPATVHRLLATIGQRLTDKLPCFLVWKRADDADTGGRPYLMAVDMTKEQAERHKYGIEEEARSAGLPVRGLVHIEESWVNHLYGETMTTGYDSLRSMVREMRERGRGG